MCINFIDDNFVRLIQATSGVFSVLVSITAIFVVWRVEIRNHKRFQIQQELTTKIANANIKPLLASHSVKYGNLKDVALYNYGSGTAIITSISFSKDKKVSNNLANIFDLGSIAWDNHWTFITEKTYLRAGEKIILVKLSAEGLIKQGKSEPEALKILEKWQKQLGGIEIKISYEDILGNKQNDYVRTYNS